MIERHKTKYTKAGPFWVWWQRAAAIRCRQALVFAHGNRNEAARLLGIDRTSLYRFIVADNQRIEQRMYAEGWIPPARRL